MNTNKARLLISKALFGAVLLAGTSVSWAASTYAYDGTVPYCAQNSTNSGTFGNTYTCQPSTSGDAIAYLTSFSTTATSATGGVPSGISSTGSIFDAAYVADYGSGAGFGVVNKYESQAAGGIGNVGTGDHAIDSTKGADITVLTFSSSVVLTQFQVGWSAKDKCSSGCTAGLNDADVSLLRYDGSSPPPVIAGKTVAQLLTDGWSYVSTWADMASNSKATVTATTASSWWILSGYNTAYDKGASGYTSGDDAFKLLSFTAQTKPTGKTPEPASLALVGFALAGLFGVSRRRTRQA